MALHLLDLPREARDNIYFALFSSTRLKFGIEYRQGPKNKFSKHLKPPENSLAILRTCKQINAEARNAWIPRVTFSFADTKTLMQKLSQLPEEYISKIQYLHLSQQWVTYNVPSSDGPEPVVVFYSALTHLRLFPSLQLDCLTMVHICCEMPDYLEHVAEHGEGWKEFRAISPFSNRTSPTYIFGMKKPAQNAQKLLLERDGQGSGAGIVLHYNSGTWQNDDLPAIDLRPQDTTTRALDIPMKGDMHLVIRRGRKADVKAEEKYASFERESPEDIVHFQERLGWDLMLEYTSHKHCCCHYYLMTNLTPGEEYDDYDYVDQFPWHKKLRKRKKEEKTEKGEEEKPKTTKIAKKTKKRKT